MVPYHAQRNGQANVANGREERFGSSQQLDLMVDAGYKERWREDQKKIL